MTVNFGSGLLAARTGAFAAAQAAQVARATFIEQARFAMPHIPVPLLKIYADAWVEHGDTSIALAVMRSDPLYDEFFAGNRRGDGTLRHSEGTYLSIRESMEETLAVAGVNPDLFATQIVENIAGNKSPLEFASEVESVRSRVLNGGDAVRQYFQQNFTGSPLAEVSDVAILAAALDPRVEAGILNEQIAVSEIGAEASTRGFQVNVDFANTLRLAGADRARARQVFAAAADQVDVFDVLAERHQDPDSDFDVFEFAQAVALDDPVQRRRMRALLARERGSFARQGVASQTGAAVTGLRRR